MLNGQIVVVTGGAGRIGAALAKAILAQNGRAMLVDVNASRLATLAEEFGPDRAAVLVGDATTPAGTDAIIEQSVARFGHIDAAVHSAYPRSAGWGTPFERLDPTHLNEDLSRHLGGAILFSQRMLEYFKRQGHGNLIHVGSIQGIAAPKFEHYAGTKMVSPIEYSAIKAGLIAITRYLAKYYKGNNIRVNCISPGGILDNQPESFLQQYRASCNDKGMLGAEDVCGTVLFLLSDLSRYITGQNIVIDDGWSL